MSEILTVVTEGGSISGFGHVARCSSIAERFREHGFLVRFVINGDDSVFPIIGRSQIERYNWLDQKVRLSETLSQSSIVLIDSIEISDDQILDIQALNIPTIFIDDERRRNVLTKGIVVDWTVLSDRKEHFLPRRENVVYFLGSRYAPIRKEFFSVGRNKIKEKLESVMITFGGSDVRNLTPFFLKNLNHILPDCKKNIIIGGGFSNLKEIEKNTDKNTRLIFNADALEMAGIMQESDMAIASSGQTLYELAAVGIPTIIVLASENAKYDALGWAETGGFVYAGRWNDKELANNFKHGVDMLKDQKQRQRMQALARDHIKPNGRELLVDSIMRAI